MSALQNRMLFATLVNASIYEKQPIGTDGFGYASMGARRPALPREVRSDEREIIRRQVDHKYVFQEDGIAAVERDRGVGPVIRDFPGEIGIR